MNWKQEALRDNCMERDKLLNKLKRLTDEAEKCNKDICKIERMINCTHETMKKGTQGSMFGGYDIDICENCGYEFFY